MPLPELLLLPESASRFLPRMRRQERLPTPKGPRSAALLPPYSRCCARIVRLLPFGVNGHRAARRCGVGPRSRSSPRGRGLDTRFEGGAGCLADGPLAYMTPMDPYSVLGLAPSAGADEVKAAYRARSRLLHPDLHRDASGRSPQAAHEAFTQLCSAYQLALETSSRPARRSAASTGRSPGSSSRSLPPSRRAPDPSVHGGCRRFRLARSDGPGRAAGARAVVRGRLAAGAPGVLRAVAPADQIPHSAHATAAQGAPWSP